MLTARSGSGGMAAVPKFDAFGREIGEDTLSGLGGSEPAPQATPQPVPATSWSEPPAAATFGAPVEDPPAAPPQPQPAAPQATFTIPGTIPVSSIPGVRRRRGMSGFGCLIGIVVLAAVVAGPIIAIVSFVGAADDAIDDVTGIIDGRDDDRPGPGDRSAAAGRHRRTLDGERGELRRRAAPGRRQGPRAAALRSGSRPTARRCRCSRATSCGRT